MIIFIEYQYMHLQYSSPFMGLHQVGLTLYCLFSTYVWSPLFLPFQVRKMHQWTPISLEPRWSQELHLRNLVMAHGNVHDLAPGNLRLLGTLLGTLTGTLLGTLTGTLLATLVGTLVPLTPLYNLRQHLPPNAVALKMRL